MPQYDTTDQEICNDMVTKIAKLARLRLTEDEVKQYQDDFTGLLEMFHALDELNFDNSVQPERLFIDADACREDEIQEVDISQLSKTTKFYNKETSYFDVPQFIGNDNE